MLKFFGIRAVTYKYQLMLIIKPGGSAGLCAWALIINLACGLAACADSPNAIGDDVPDVGQPQDPQCAQQLNGVGCDDGDPCTVNEVCSDGICTDGLPNLCASTNGCQIGNCIEGLGCKFLNKLDGVPCESLCFSSSSCSVGFCVPVLETSVVCPSSPNSCVDRLECDVQTGECSIEVYAESGVSCDADEAPCTLDQCNGNGGCTYSEPNTCAKESDGSCWNHQCEAGVGCKPTSFKLGASCDDKNGCTYSDTCLTETIDDELTEKCAGTPVLVDDQNECTDDSCADGKVIHNPLDGAQCSPTDPCATSGVCSAGSCDPIGACECLADQDCPEQVNLCAGVSFCNLSGEFPKCDILAGTPVVCEESGIACSMNQCKPSTGLCQQNDLEDGVECDDNDPCTQSTVCISTECSGGDLTVCDDGAYCNGLESCVEDGNCEPGEAVEVDDGIPCTVDACDDVLGVVTHSPSDLPCGDGEFCNGAEYCDEESGCQPGIPPVLDDGLICTMDSCDEGANTVIHTINHTVCNDGDICDGTELCDPVNDCIHDPAQMLPDGVMCSDNNACTKGDICKDQTCSSVPLDCNDNNPCTVDTCDIEKGCAYTSVDDSTPCYDGNPCTVSTLCVLGQCTGGSVLPQGSPCDDSNKCTTTSHCEGLICTVVDVLTCDDDNVCTSNACDPKVGCVFAPQDGECYDGNLCSTTGSCLMGQCTGIVAVSCPAPDACHLDGQCIQATGKCVFPNNADSTLCDDGNACTSPDVCSAGVCNGSSIICDDGNPCTVDSCDIEIGCQYTNVSDGGACETGSPCAVNEICTQGQCDGGTVQADGTSCDDKDACTELTSCQNGACGSGAAIACNDGNPCTTDSCDSSVGCVQSAAQGPCNTSCWCSDSVCVALDDGYSVTWSTFWSHSLNIQPTKSYYGNGSLASQGPGQIGGVTAWAQNSNWNALWVLNSKESGSGGENGNDDDNGINPTTWSSSVQFYRPAHAKLRYSILGSPGAGLFDSQTGLVLWVNKVANPFEPAKVELIEKSTGAVLAQVSLIGSVDQWTNLRAELDGTKNTVKGTIGGKVMGPIAILPESLSGTHIGLSSYADCCELTGVGWRLLEIEKGSSVTQVAEGCAAPKCGDGIVNASGEACDDGNLSSDDGCSAACKEETMVFIPSGLSWQGCKSELDASCVASAMPAHEIYLTAYYMDRREVTVSQYGSCVAAGICNGNLSNDGLCNFGKAGREQHPINCVPWQSASIYCAWSGKVLPTEAQWERAARGGCELYSSQECSSVFPKYPWGDESVSCNLAAVSGCGETLQGTQVVGGYPAGASAYGLYDMSGNVAEWTRDWYSPFYYGEAADINPQGPASGTSRSVRGSSYIANVFGSSTLLALWFREAVPPNQAKGHVGFRCVKPAN
ncbi:MAG TPA: hypothetical protein EYN66_17145 [Myxococcales bacterium]|nr:hypothetical protein [Myxococcales bacterium]